MNRKSTKQPRQAKLAIHSESLPTPGFIDPTKADRQIVDFNDDVLEKFLNRELLRKKLKKGSKPEEKIIIPDASPMEEKTREHYLYLKALAHRDESGRMEVKILKLKWRSNSLFNVATRLAELELQEAERQSMKRYWRPNKDGAAAIVRPALVPGK